MHLKTEIPIPKLFSHTENINIVFCFHKKSIQIKNVTIYRERWFQCKLFEFSVVIEV